MANGSLNDFPRWLRRPLCRRYAYVRFSEFWFSELQDDVPCQRHWLCGFGVFTPNEFEILGAWPADTGTFGTVAQDLRSRGVLSIRVTSTDEGEMAIPDSSERWIRAAQDGGPRVLAVVSPQAAAADAVEGVPSSTIQSAIHEARRIQIGLVRNARARSPLPSAKASSEFISNWLQKADSAFTLRRRPLKTSFSSAASREPRPS